MALGAVWIGQGHHPVQYLVVPYWGSSRRRN